MRIIKTIMIVDDEATVGEKVKSYLDNDELDIITANNSRQALELMEKGETFDLILIDTPMPCSDKAALFLMKPNSNLTTGGTDTFLQKPFTKEQLVNFVKGRI
ncbi:MAG: response regulator [Thermoplasmatales archaeon]|nr:MAG: response regulator [Thermoplasmatales archaeon]